jgi:hypothetical protein
LIFYLWDLRFSISNPKLFGGTEAYTDFFYYIIFSQISSQVSYWFRIDDLKECVFYLDASIMRLEMFNDLETFTYVGGSGGLDFCKIGVSFTFRRFWDMEGRSVDSSRTQPEISNMELVWISTIWIYVLLVRAQLTNLLECTSCHGLR